MSFTVTSFVGGYGGVTDLSIRIYVPGTNTRVNGTDDDLMTEGATEIFTGTIDEDLVGLFEYRIFRGAGAIQTGWLYRESGQAAASLDQPVIVMDSGNGGKVTRSATDTNPISFLWPTSDATFVVRRSINDAAFEDAIGTVGTAIRQEGARWRYQLSYDAADRPSDEGKVQYELTADSVTRYLSVRVEGGGTGGGGDATLAKQEEILSVFTGIDKLVKWLRY
jgi:hypothetical protein